MPTDFLEKTVEDIVFENKEVIHNYGLPKFRKTVFRQFVLPSGKKLDIVAFDLIDGHLILDIYELKRHEINTDAICQAYNYFIQVTQLTAGKFKSVDIHIIMVGRWYDPFMLFEKMELPFSVYTYDYKLTGMTFRKHRDSRQPRNADENFSLGLWAFGTGQIGFTNGQPNTVNMANIYANWKENNFHSHLSILSQTGSIFTKPTVKEITVTEYIKQPSVKTEVFPLQPSWTTSFAKDIPPDEHMFDLENEDCDYEFEYTEADTSDWEPEIDEEDFQRAQTPTIEEIDLELDQIIKLNTENEEHNQTA